jgi:hypothetical protein
LHILRFFNFCTFCIFCIFVLFVLRHLVGQSTWISMQNLESVAQEKAELWVLLYYFVLLYFVRTVHTNFHAKSGLCSSRNEWVMLNLVFAPPPLRSIPVTNLRIELRASRQLTITIVAVVVVVAILVNF